MDQQGGIVGLGHPVNASSRATTISSDGSTIVGFYEDPVQGFRRPVRWITGSTDLFLGDGMAGVAIGVSSDGKQIVGQPQWHNPRAFDYTVVQQAWYRRRAERQLDRPERGDPSLRQRHRDWGEHQHLLLDEPAVHLDGENWHAAAAGRPRSQRRGHSAPLTLTNVLAVSADGSTIMGLVGGWSFNQGAWIAHLHGKSSLRK